MQKDMTAFRTRVALGIAALVGVQLAATFGLRSEQWVHPTLLFWIVVVAASLCVVTSVVLIGIARRNNQAELGLVGSFYAAISTMAVVHGLTTPGLLYADNTATAASVFWGVPVATVAMAPSVLRSTALGRRLSDRWLAWTVGSYLGVLALCGVMLADPNLVPVPAMGSATATIACAGFAAISIALGWRHVRLAEVAQRPGPLVITFGFTLIACSVLVFLSGPMFAPHFWLAHAVDIFGVFLATIGGVVVYLREGSTRRVLAPIVAVDAHAALEVGLSPVVHAFVADLEAKDELTRDHVIRSGALAVDVALKLGLDAADVRRAGLVGLLHDVGKITIPDEILTKPGRLTDDEFAVMKTHTTAGCEMLAAAPGLEDLAHLVESHHERLDGGGYPNRLAGDDIPLVARIVSACDAFDAITVSRHYRDGRPADVAHEILREHAGSQWDPRVVDALIELTSDPGFIVGTPTALDGVGHGDTAHGGTALDNTAHAPIGCDCVPALTGADG